MIRYVLIGYGQRGKFYVDCLREKGMGELVAICDSNRNKLDLAKKNYNLQEEQLFSSADLLFQKGKIADLAIIASMDNDHYEQAIAALNLGYNLLLEKPIAQTEEQCREIAALAKKMNRLAGYKHSAANVRMLLRMLTWAARKESELNKAFSSNILTECNYYSQGNLYALINNSDKQAETTFYDINGQAKQTVLQPNELRWIKQ